METFNLKIHPEVKIIFDAYPDHIREKMQWLRSLVIETAEETDGIHSLEETLKWGEPAYVTRIGSTLRMDWKKKRPEQYGLYFQCTSRLVSTFRIVFKNTFTFEGNRAIIFRPDEKVPEKELKECIRASLTYHKVKHLMTLGI